MKILKIVSVVIVFYLSTSANGIELAPFDGAFSYSRNADARAYPNDGFFNEYDFESAVITDYQWINPVVISNYSADLLSPVPGKVYDTSPVLYGQPDGSVAPYYSFDYSFASSYAGVDINDNYTFSDFSIYINSLSSSGAHVPDGYTAENGSVSSSFSDSYADFNTLFTVFQEPGDASTFTMNVNFVESFFSDVFTTTPTDIYDYGSFLQLSASLSISNLTTGDVLLNETAPLEPWLLGLNGLDPSYLPGGNTISDLNYGDIFELQMKVSSGSTATSSSEVVFTDPSCDPVINGICYVDHYAYEVQDVFANASLDLGLSVETTVIPIPSAVWLFGSGIISFVGFARRKKAY